jgi:hypothetical protein
LKFEDNLENTSAVAQVSVTMVSTSWAFAIKHNRLVIYGKGQVTLKAFALVQASDSNWQ